MQDVIDVLQKRFDEISEFMMRTQEERKTAINRVSELDVALEGADRDQRKLNKAMNALRDDDDNPAPIGALNAKLMTASAPVDTERSYRPGR